MNPDNIIVTPVVPNIVVSAAGSRGVQGTQGIQGEQGLQGVQGTTGVQGFFGTQGTQGVQGTQGTQGVQGVQGILGLQGSTGAQGITGSQGIQGRQGTTGSQGTTGAQGTTGTQGIIGSQGIQGRQGTQGLTGVQGITGTQGLTGLQGATGTQGATGLQGLIGLQGIQGNQGTTGTQGLTGIQGTQGIQGNVGTGVTILGSYPTYEALILAHPTGANGDAYIVDPYLYVWSSTTSSWNNVGVVQGPQGTTGTQGTDGSIGAQGTQGLIGSQGTIGTQGTAGYVGADGAQGTQGIQGITGANGIQGTIGTQGAIGSQGLTGIQGATGTQGFNGTQGTTGSQGLTGIQGTTGTTGDTGAQGTTGSQGTNGANGSQGLTGLQGVTGSQGTSGTQGTTGTQGNTGSNGSQGTTGAQGVQGLTGTQGIQGTLGLQGVQGTTPAAYAVTWKKTASGGETTLSGSDDNSVTLAYTIGQELLHINGVLQVRGTDYTASTGTSITGLSALLAGDIVAIWCPTSFNIANAIQSTIVTAKGDLLAASGSGTVTNLAVGSDGSTLVANSAASTGVSWAGPSFMAGRNKIINGDFGVWQRGTSFSTPSGLYTADRWRYGTDGSGTTSTVSQQTFTPGTAPVAGYEGTYFCRFNQTVAGSGATFNILTQRIEDVRTFAGQTVAFSFWAKADTTRNIQLQVGYVYGSGGSSAVYTLQGSPIALTTSWARYTVTFTVASLSGKTIGSGSYLEMQFFMPINTTQTIDIWGVQLEAGSVATPFTTATGTIQGELAACQRYYYRTIAPTAASTFIGSSTTAFEGVIPFPVTMRGTGPNSIDSSNTRLTDTVSVFNSTALTLNSSNTNNNNAYLTGTVASGLTQYRTYIFSTNSGYIGFSAEL